MTLLDAFQGIDLVEMKKSIRQIVKDPQTSRVVTYTRAGKGPNFATGTSAPVEGTRQIRAVGGPTQDRHSGEWSVGTRTYLVLKEDFLVPKPSIVPARGDFIAEADGTKWRIEDVDRGELGELLYYVLRTRTV